MRPPLVAAAVPLALALLAPASGADAKPPPGPGAAPAPAVKLAPDALARLRSGDPAQVKGALDDVRMSGKAGAPAVPAIAELLQQGPAACAHAGRDRRHRRHRERARAATQWRGTRATGTWRSGARRCRRWRTRAGPPRSRRCAPAWAIRIPGVRGLSATGLGSMKAKEAVDDLFVALEHKVAEAAASIGQLCSAGECDRLAAKLGLGAVRRRDRRARRGHVPAARRRERRYQGQDRRTACASSARARPTGSCGRAGQVAQDVVAAGQAGHRPGRARDGRVPGLGPGGAPMRRAGVMACALATLAACGGGNGLRGARFSDRLDRRRRRVDRARLGRPRHQPIPASADVVVGVAGHTDKLVGLPLGGGSKWTFAHPLDARPIVTGGVVVGSGGGEVFALDARSGRAVWRRPTGGLPLLGAGDDGAVTVVTLRRAGGIGSTLLAVQHDGQVVQQIETDKALGAPARARALRVRAVGEPVRLGPRPVDRRRGRARDAARADLARVHAGRRALVRADDVRPLRRAHPRRLARARPRAWRCRRGSCRARPS